MAVIQVKETLEGPYRASGERPELWPTNERGPAVATSFLALLYRPLSGPGMSATRHGRLAIGHCSASLMARGHSRSVKQ